MSVGFVENDPNRPARSLQSCPTLCLGISCFASTKQPTVTSGSRPPADVRLAARKPTINLPDLILRLSWPRRLPSRPGLTW